MVSLNNGWKQEIMKPAAAKGSIEVGIKIKF